MINQFLDVRSIAVTDHLTDEEFARKKQIEQDISYGYDRKKNMEDSSSTSENSGKKIVEVGEMFDNNEIQALSPNFYKEVDPLRFYMFFFPVEFEDLEQTLAAGNTFNVSLRKQISLLLSCTALLIANVDFAVAYHTNGGIFFLLPYFFFLIVFAFPMSLFEFGIGQFASVPIFNLFHKMAPILGGIPYLIFFNRFSSLVTIIIQPKLYLYTVRMLFTLITDADQWSTCKDYPQLLCYQAFTDCAVNKFYDGHKCVIERGDADVKHISPYALIDFTRARFVKHVGFSASTLFSIAKSLDVSDNLTAVIVFFAITGYLFFRGYRVYAKSAIVLTVLPVFVLIPIFFLVSSGIVQYRASSVLREIVKANKPSKLMTITAFIDAFRLACGTVELANGGLFTLGSKQPFKTNFVKGMVVLTIYGALYRILFALVITPLYFYLTMIVLPDSKNAENTSDMRYNMIEMFFEALPVSTDPSWKGKILHFMLALFYLSINLASVTHQLITFEVLVSYAYRKFSRLLYVPGKYVRLLVIVAVISIVLIVQSDYYHENIKPGGSQRRMKDMNWYLAFFFITMFSQFFGIHSIYGNERVFVNCLTMLRDEKSSQNSFELFNYFKTSIIFIWYSIPAVSAVCLCLSLQDLFHLITYDVAVYSLMGGFPLLYCFRLGFNTIVAGQKLSMVGLTHNWCPRNAHNARAALHDEKGFRIVH